MPRKKITEEVEKKPYLNADGTWSQFTEVTSAGNPGEYSLASATNRFDSSAIKKLILFKS